MHRRHALRALLAEMARHPRVERLDLQPRRHDEPMIAVIACGCTVDALTWAGRWAEAVAVAHQRGLLGSD